MEFKNFLSTLVEANNESGMIIGKFRLLTNAHVQLINDAIKQFGKATVVMVTGKDTAETQDLRYKALMNTFGKNKNVEIIQTPSAFISNFLPRCSFNPIALLCGTDRVKTYEGMLKRCNLDWNIVETKRADEDISATKVIANLNDQTFFEKNTPKAIHSMYNKYVSSYSALMSESYYDIFDGLEDILEGCDLPENPNRKIYPSTYADKVRAKGDNEDADDENTIEGGEDDLTDLTDENRRAFGSSAFDGPLGEEGEYDGECDGECDGGCDSVGTGTSDVATVDNVVGGITRRKKPQVNESRKSFREFF